jgi:hypothetical protein
MRIVDVRQGHEQEDIEEGQRVLDAEIAHPSMSVMIIRWNTSEMSKFVDRVGTRCDPFPWRSAVWVKNDAIFTQKNQEDWFDGHDKACAVILDLNDEPAEWLEPDATLFDIEQAWLSAEGRSK